jgi:NAD(P)H-nitrite reductase large subunit
MKYVIIGNSFAGLFAAETIRKTDSEGEIWIVSRERQHVYSRAMIHEMLSGVVTEPMVYLRDWDFYTSNRVHALLGREVTGIDPSAKTIRLDDEEDLPYDRLLIATGSRPFVPPIEGLDEVDFNTFTTLEEAKALKEATIGKKDAVVLGAGLIGLQCAEALAHLGLNVTVVEMADMVLPQALDVPSSKIISRDLEAEGLQLRLGNTIEHIHSDGRQPTACSLKSGEHVPCDVLVIAVGVRSNIDIAKDADIVVDRGIVVNSRMETNIEDIYSAGDCAQGPEILSGMTMTIPVIPVASTHGMIAGYNMAGVNRVYGGGLSLNALQFGGTSIVSYGFIKDETDGEVISVGDESSEVYKKIIIKDGKITGAVFVRDIERVGLFRHLIENRIDVTSFKEHLFAPDFGVGHLPEVERARMFTTPQ